MDKRIFTVIKKELKRIFTDRRLVFTTMILPALSIFIMYSLMGFMINSKIDSVKENVPDIVCINAPNSFVEFVKDSTDKFKFVDDKKENYEKDLIKGDIEIILQFDKDFDQMIENYNAPNIERYYNKGEDFSLRARHKIDGLLSAYKDQLLGIRIGNKDHLNVFTINKGVENDSIQDDRKTEGKGFGILFPMLIAIFLFSGAMSVGPDMIAGEKERKTMAAMLLTPIKRETLAIGKVISLGIIAIITSLSSFIGIIASIPYAGKMFQSDGIEISALKFTAKEFTYLIFIMLTLVSVYVAIVCVISIISKTIKEANTYISPVYLVVMIAGFSTMYLEGAIASWKFAVPIYGSIIAMKKLFVFELTGMQFGISCVSSLVFTGICIYIIKVLFNNEKVMFN